MKFFPNYCELRTIGIKGYCNAIICTLPPGKQQPMWIITVIGILIFKNFQSNFDSSRFLTTFSLVEAEVSLHSEIFFILRTK